MTIGIDLHFLVLVADQFVDLGEGLGGNDDSDVLFRLEGALQDGQPVAVHGHHGGFVRLDHKQFTGVRRFFVVLADGVDGLVDHLMQLAGLQGQGGGGAGVRQGGEVVQVQGGQLKFCRTTANFHGAVVVQGQLHFAGGHPPDHVAQQFCVQHALAGGAHVGLDGNGDGQFQIVAGEGQAEAVRHHVNSLQRRDGRAERDCPADTVNGIGEKRLFTDNIHLLVLFPGLIKTGEVGTNCKPASLETTRLK